MAFHLPTRQAIQRPFHPHVAEDVRQAPQQATSAIEESQTWILFSPAPDVESASYLTETHHTESTPGRSRLSDLGSLHTIARSDSVGHRRSPSSNAVDDDEEDEEEEEDDAELDSLDSHLPEFRSTPYYHNSAPGLAPIVPAHDGLGSFRLDHDGMGPDVQNRLFSFEQYNPRRVKRRRESLELAQVELDIEQEQEVDKMGRIEAWRLEQSRCFLEEIQRETRRRRRSAASARPAVDRAQDSTTASIHPQTNRPVTSDEEDAWHDQQASDLGESESIWGRITRKVIRDIMGIDDKLLSILFGESLPDEDDLSSTPKASTLMPEPSQHSAMSNSGESSWQIHMLERIAKELGLFVHHISEHPGAFSTYTRMQQMPIPYAGLPPIAETNDPTKTSVLQGEPTTSMPEFKPTISPQTRPMNVPQARAVSGIVPAVPQVSGDKPADATTFTQEEWEQDMDVRLVFRYLRSRFMSRSSSTGSISGNPHLATSSNQDVAAKAARVRQHHPLVSKTRPSERRTFKSTTPSTPVIFRRASSCASQSTRRSVRRSSCSSRHYWDIGAGSVGTGSFIAAAGPMGSWGEV
jgi:hypothetical protein